MRSSAVTGSLTRPSISASLFPTLCVSELAAVRRAEIPNSKISSHDEALLAAPH